jgi:hypothetical protein
METTIDRDLLLQLVNAVSCMLHMLSVEHSIAHMDLIDRLAGLPPSEDTKRQQEWAHARFQEAGQRLEQLKMLVEGKSLREIDAHFDELDKRSEKRQREISRSFDRFA